MEYHFCARMWKMAIYKKKFEIVYTEFLNLIKFNF